MCPLCLLSIIGTVALASTTTAAATAVAVEVVKPKKLDPQDPKENTKVSPRGGDSGRV